jgi:hypothetical protein
MQDYKHRARPLLNGAGPGGVIIQNAFGHNHKDGVIRYPDAGIEATGKKNGGGQGDGFIAASLTDKPG